MCKIFFSLLLIVLTAVTGFAQSGNPVPEPPPALEMRVSAAPIAAAIDGKPNLVYEIYLTNLSSQSLCLNNLQIINAKNARLISEFSGKELVQRFYQPGLKSTGSEGAILSPGGSSVVYVEMVLASGEIPRNLVHKISGSVCGTGSVAGFTVQGAKSPVSDEPAAFLGAPLKGGPWAAVFSPLWERGHRRVIYTLDGTARIPGRWAIDFIRLNENGQYSAGSENEIKNWYGYDSDVLAAADGVISSTRNDFPESATLKDHPQYKSPQAAGNYISIKIAENRYAFYEHLKPGSILVKPGQKVRKGMVIAKLGFTGQTTGPHLHFHLANADSPLGAEGLPFVFEKFTLLGSYADFSLFGKSRWQSTDSSSQSEKHKEHPLSNSVIKFN